MLPQKIWQNQEIDCKKYEKIRNFPQNFAKSGTRAQKQGKIKNLSNKHGKIKNVTVKVMAKTEIC